MLNPESESKPQTLEHEVSLFTTYLPYQFKVNFGFFYCYFIIVQYDVGR